MKQVAKAFQWTQRHDVIVKGLRQLPSWALEQSLAEYHRDRLLLTGSIMEGRRR